MIRCCNSVIMCVFILFFAQACDTGRSKSLPDGRSAFIQKIQNRNSAILDKKIDLKETLNIDSIQSPGSQKTIIIVSMLSDCSGCRKTAYSVAKRINQLEGRNISYIVGTNIKVEAERANNGLSGLTYIEDTNLSLKRSIGLSHTPSIIFLVDEKIKNILSVFPFQEVPDFDEEQQITDFISTVIFN